MMEVPYVMIKSGMYYAHNSRGYVHRVELAELYSREYAEGHEARCSGEVLARPVTNFICDADHINEVIERLEAMRDAIELTAYPACEEDV